MRVVELHLAVPEWMYQRWKRHGSLTLGFREIEMTAGGKPFKAHVVGGGIRSDDQCLTMKGVRELQKRIDDRPRKRRK